MADHPTRTGKELQLASRPFLEESRGKSWRLVLSTLLATVTALAVAALSPSWPLRLGCSLLGSLLLVRSFILFHDFHHGALLHGSRLARWLINPVGFVMLVPPRSWRQSHNYHHAHVAQVDTPAIGAFPVMSVPAWRAASPWQRFQYRVTRHPLTLLAAGLTVFALNITLVPLFKHPRHHWDSLLAVALHGGLLFGLWELGGRDAMLFGFLLPYLVSTALGAYLFYSQHNFPGVRMLAPAEWSYTRAALESSSQLLTGRTLTWFTGNIGYHHAHHLNPAIPFYRLPEAVEALPELQRPKVTSLRPWDIVACLRCNLWDPQAGAMVRYRAAAADAHASHGGLGPLAPTH